MTIKCKNALCLVLIILGPFSILQAQGDEATESYKYYSFTIGYGYEIPGGDLSDRFGNNLKFTLGGQHLSEKNWLFELEANVLFGDKVKEDVIQPLRNPNGVIINSFGFPADVFLRQRGLVLTVNTGKIFPISSTQSGVRLSGGVGVMAHKVNILDESQATAQFFHPYDKGYDRLSRGLALKQQIGYEIHSANGRINLNLLFECTQAFTSDIRTRQFYTDSASEGSRLDLLYSFKATYMLPIRRIASGENIIYY